MGAVSDSKMKSRIFNTLSLISAILLACTVILWVWSFWANPYKSNLSVSNALHIGLCDGRIEFFSDKFGPYHGSIIALTSPSGRLSAYLPRGGILGIRLASTTVISAGPTRGPCCGR